MRIDIPKYIIDILSRAEFVVGSGAPGYSIRICKRTAYTYAETLKQEVNNLVRWVRRQMPKDYPWDESPIAVVKDVPMTTRYNYQYAYLDIYDPVMQEIEKYIKNEK